jgi:carboxyl-terminal processing protease
MSNHTAPAILLRRSLLLVCALAMAAGVRAEPPPTPPTPAASADAPTGLQLAAQAISRTLHQHLFDPAALNGEAFKAIEQRVEQLAATAASRRAFIDGFNQAWAEGPFSHVRLAAARQTAEQTAQYLDTLRVGAQGAPGAALSWQSDVAVLTVNTMMGLDTIEQIEAAYQALHTRPARALIIDLRHNKGGAFAVRPLVSHVIDAPLDAGVFTSQAWAREHGVSAPTRSEVQRLAPWQGWSIRTFWRDVQAQAVTRIVFEPTAPRYAGPVYVLTSRRTASAAELATDALLASGRAVVVGEQTAGQMLSQKMYDLPQGLQLYLPIADYHAAHSGRIEGAGVQPTVAVAADQALAEALRLIDAAHPRP